MASLALQPSSREFAPGNGFIAILGAGSLGRLLSALLPPERTGFIRRPGKTTPPTLEYRFSSVDGDTRPVTRSWLDESRHRIGLLLVTTKAGHTLDALDAVMDRLPGECPVVLFQNGMGSQQWVAGRWPERPILAASTTEAAHRPMPEQLVHAATGYTWVGPLTPAAVPCTDRVVRELTLTGLDVRADAQISERLWEKLVINAGINPFTAILDCPNGDILDAPLFTRNIDGLCLELRALMAAEGMTAPSASTLRQRIERVAGATARNTSSMRGDILNRRPTEIDYINGYVVRRARELGLEAPVNQMLTERVKELVSHP
ncbi:ketopantoate reductase [Marinobacter daqiaonensis]|uniref:2-dehydropantoate 2-reductase n=1 Tax=Marinobacter daqiaonensis TaxID=650891 RepID=A0A1I6GGA8_9GAMM|nr:2-dehydropantoate 2-reductase [Marinobacter daqiaonensis]SFR41226.1 ketopantoate reductase [Marinobacter daqiaonensis]